MNCNLNMAVIIQVQLLTCKLVELLKKLCNIQAIFVSSCGAFDPLISCSTSVPNIIETYVTICQYDSVIHMHEVGCHARETEPPSLQ